MTWQQIDAQLKSLESQIVAETNLIARNVVASKAELAGVQREYQDRQIKAQANKNQAEANLQLAKVQLERLQTEQVLSVTFSPNGQQIASGSWDNTINIWNSQTGELLQTLQGHTARVISIAFSIDGKKVVSGSIDNTVKVWNLESGQLLYTFTNHSNWILGVAVTSDKIFSASKDTTIRISTMPR